MRNDFSIFGSILTVDMDVPTYDGDSVDILNVWAGEVEVLDLLNESTMSEIEAKACDYLSLEYQLEREEHGDFLYHQQRDERGAA